MVNLKINSRLKSIIKWIILFPEYADIDLILKNYAYQVDNYTFLVIGANDGNDNDIIKEIITSNKAKGLLVEPQVAVYEQLLLNYKKYKDIKCVNAAIDAQSDERILYKLNFSNLRWASGLSSFNKNIIIKHFKNGYIQNMALSEGIAIKGNYEKYIEEVEVNTYSVDDLLEMNTFPYPNIIFLDTEGYDFEIIKTLKLRNSKLNFIFFEHIHLNRLTFYKCIYLLKFFNYKLFYKGRDILAVKKQTWRIIQKGFSQ